MEIITHVLTLALLGKLISSSLSLANLIRASVTTFKTIMDDLVSRELKKVTANSGAKPKADTKPQVNVPTKDIMKMTYHERRQLAQENPELYNQLMGIK